MVYKACHHSHHFLRPSQNRGYTAGALESSSFSLSALFTAWVLRTYDVMVRLVVLYALSVATAGKQAR